MPSFNPDRELFRTTASQLEVFVDGTNGNDNNSGLTSTNPLQTLDGVYRKFPLFTLSGGRILIHLAGTGGFGAAATAQLVYTVPALWIGGSQPRSNAYQYRGPNMVRIVPATGPATAAPDAVPAVLVGLRTRFDFVGAAPAWTVNNLVGSFLRITRAGTLVLWELPITENDADQLFVDVIGIVGNVLNTDTYEIVEPGARINGTDGSLQIIGLNGASDVIASSGGGEIFERLTFGSTRLASGTGRYSFDRCQFTGTILALNFSDVGVINCISKSTGGFFLEGGSITSTRVTSRQEAAGNPITQAPQMAMLFCGGATLFLGGTQGGIVHAQFSLPLSCYDGNNGILISGPGSLLFMGDSATPNVALQGARNASAGIRCTKGGQARIAGGVNTTLSGGAAGPLRLDSGGSIAYGSGAGQLEDAASWNGNFCRQSLRVAGQGAANIAAATTVTLGTIIRETSERLMIMGWVIQAVAGLAFSTGEFNGLAANDNVVFFLERTATADQYLVRARNNNAASARDVEWSVLAIPPTLGDGSRIYTSAP